MKIIVYYLRLYREFAPDISSAVFPIFHRSCLHSNKNHSLHWSFHRLQRSKCQADLQVFFHTQTARIFSLYTNNIRPDIRMLNAHHQRKVPLPSPFSLLSEVEGVHCAGRITVYLGWLLPVCFLTFYTNSLCFNPVSNWRSCDIQFEVFFYFSDCIRDICRRIFIEICFQFIR